MLNKSLQEIKEDLKALYFSLLLHNSKTDMQQRILIQISISGAID